MRVFCGEAMCKRPLTTAITAATSYPVNCDSCGAPLYPVDLMPGLHGDRAGPDPAELRVLRGHRLMAVTSAELARMDRGDPPQTSRTAQPDATTRRPTRTSSTRRPTHPVEAGRRARPDSRKVAETPSPANHSSALLGIVAALAGAALVWWLLG